MTPQLKEAIKVIDDLKDYCVLWHFSLGGSVLNPKRMPQDIDIIVNHADEDKLGQISVISSFLRKAGYQLGPRQKGCCNTNYHAYKINCTPLHIIIYQ